MRLNCGIPPLNLTDEHLFAESRELKMLPALYKRVGDKNKDKVPKEFTLGKGHMLFFLYKWQYTFNRYYKCVAALIMRGYNVGYEHDKWDIYVNNCKCGEEYEETSKEAEIVRLRIIEKIKASPKKYFHYYGEKITKDEAIDLLRKGRY